MGRWGGGDGGDGGDRPRRAEQGEQQQRDGQRAGAQAPHRSTAA